MSIPSNSIRLDIFIDPPTGDLQIDVMDNLSSELGSKQVTYYSDVVSGLIAKLHTEIGSFNEHGSLLRELSDLYDHIDNLEDDLGVDFEPDEELLEAIKKKEKEGNVIKFKKKLH
tara:strand:+ start:168 stop:512 length:345 start_codon:yes stop_codon:yes gene_type:complete